jgi:hypothetical protein
MRSPLGTLAVLGAALLTVGCGTSKPSDFMSGPPGSSPSGEEGGAAGGADATTSTPFQSADGGFFVAQGGSQAGDGGTSVCTAGVYRGQFMTLVGAGSDGGAPGLFNVMWNGNLSIDLKAKTVTIVSGTGVGEGTTTDTSLLEISDGGALEGGDMYGGSFYATLDGELDCDPSTPPPYHLSATLSDGRYTSLFYNLPISGQLTADYQASSPPALTNGQILVYSPDAGPLLTAASASGSWSATWVSP